MEMDRKDSIEIDVKFLNFYYFRDIQDSQDIDFSCLYSKTLICTYNSDHLEFE